MRASPARNWIDCTADLDDNSIDPGLVERCQSTARVCALAVMTLGIAVLIGWAQDIGVLKSVLPGWVAMKANTALGLLLAGGSLVAAGQVRKTPGWRALHLFLAAMATLLGLLTLGEYLFAADFGIDQLLAMAPAEPISVAPPGRMALATAGSFAVTGLALFLLDNHRGRIVSQATALTGMLIGVLAIIGYVHGVAALYGVGADSKVALHTAVGLVAINLGVLLSRPQRGLMAVIISKTAGGVMARRLLPLALIAPLLIGWLRIQGEQRGFYDARFGLGLVALSYMLMFTAFIWRTAEFLRDSEQRRSASEQARRHQQAQLSGIIDSAMDAILMIDAAQRIVLFNPAAEQMFGRQSADVVGGPLAVLLPQRFRAQHFEHICACGANAATSQRMAELGIITGLRANGEEFPIEASFSQLEADGGRYYTAILCDLTESRRVQEALRESEAHLKLAMEVAQIGIWERSLATGTGIWSTQTKTIMGLDADTYTFDDFAKRIHPEDLLRMHKLLAAPIAGTPFENEYRIIRPNGEIRWVNERGQVICDAQGNALSVLGAALDITERRATEDALRASQADAERANNGKSRFLAAASHDLRQPLSALSIYANVLKNHVAPPGQHLLANLNDCIGSLSELLADLLDLSKLEAGVVTPKRSNFPIADTLASLTSIHAPEAQLKGLRLRFVCSSLTAYSDPILLGRILGNLISNAIRYTERGGVLVGCRRRLGKTWVEVWDTGIGIPEDKIVEVFEEFKQLGDDARTRGSGLGLTIVARTTALLGLEIKVRSWLGRGSVFAIELPLGQEKAVPMLERRAATHRPLRIALVEDNAEVRQALAHALMNASHQVVAAVTGEELRTKLGGVPPDIVISDYRLTQGETGFEVIAAIRAATRADLPAILITGDTEAKLMRSMADRGIAVLYKPLDLEMLQATLEGLTCQDKLMLH
jgi:two-component system, sensor histidine kinase